MNRRQLSMRYQINKDAVATRIGDQIVLVQTGTDRIFSLNPTAARFWELLSASHTLSEIESVLLQEFDVEKNKLAEEMKNLLGRLVDERFIMVHPDGTDSKE